MRLALLGATGGIGGHVLAWALDAGHTVHALARRPGAPSLAALSPAAGLAVTAGDALDAGAVAEVIAEADAVVSALGPRGAKSLICWPGPPRTSWPRWRRPGCAG
ncbi:MAG TPA: NAD(P)H-binding protein [Streptosporangiaceae bacterium]|nr:NAD(P)H-binding protein [Streptosporangiaceae bacterium]